MFRDGSILCSVIRLLAIGMIGLVVGINPQKTTAQSIPCRKEGSAAHASLNEMEVENIVRRSVQYVAMYNVIHKVVDAAGLNTLMARSTLLDHTVVHIARPSNDFLFGGVVFDVRDDAVVLDIPTFDSDYVSLEVCGYDHYCDVILSTRTGDFTKPTRILFYTNRTRSYRGETVDGVDQSVKMTCDFSRALFRIMPHRSNKERFKNNVEQLNAINVRTLSQLRGEPSRSTKVTFPPFGKTNADVYGTNLTEVMQFVFNHTDLEPSDGNDREVLDAYQEIGITPVQTYDTNRVASIDNALFRKVAETVTAEEQAKLGTEAAKRLLKNLFRPKGRMELDGLVFQSVVGPFGLPLEEATYATLSTIDGEPMNANNDYVIRMAKDDLPPGQAFWSFTLYDTKTGFLLPNDRKKYSVGHNTGMQMDRDGGITITIAAERPSGVSEENWLPTIRRDQSIDVVCRIYVPDLKRLKTWQPPNVVLAP